jgi:lipopolysaccharide/colanic/teichoic acid biosynthesis glycosyltransferase
MRTDTKAGLATFLPRSSRQTGATRSESRSTFRSADIERIVPLVVDDPAQRASQSSRIDDLLRSPWLNRGVNLTLAAIALVLLSPLLLLVCLAVRLTSPGPIFHVQIRVGLDRRGGRPDTSDGRRRRDLGGRVFRIYKFRSMFVDAERRSGAVWATKGDPRITPLGRYLRKLRIDEIPQLLNVVLGDMNIVGPRPERPTLFAELRDAIDEYPLRQRAKPGITGWAQINQSYDSCLSDVKNKVRYDLEYIDRQNVVEDVRIMLRTLPVMLFQRGGW